MRPDKCARCGGWIHPLMNVRATGGQDAPMFVHYDCWREIVSASAQERKQK